MKYRVLFVCRHNSARSQMAEGFLRHFGGEQFEVFSAGTEADAVRPEALQVMSEVWIDISGQESKTLERSLGQPFDWVVTVCDEAREACPLLSGVSNSVHWEIEDPTQSRGTDEEPLSVYRRVRDDLSIRIRTLALTARGAAILRKQLH